MHNGQVSTHTVQVPIVPSIVLGALFIFAGSYKILSPSTSLRFTMEVIGLNDAGTTELVKYTVLSIAALEVVVGIHVVLRRYWAIMVIASMLILFTCILVFATAKGIEVSCGCFPAFGIMEKPLTGIIRNTVLIILALWCLAPTISRKRFERMKADLQ